MPRATPPLWNPLGQKPDHQHQGGLAAGFVSAPGQRGLATPGSGWVNVKWVPLEDDGYLQSSKPWKGPHKHLYALPPAEWSLPLRPSYTQP